MNAKKLIALLLAVVLCLSFAACGGNDEPETTTEAPVAESTEAVDATEAPSEVESTEAASEAESTEPASEVESTEAASEEATEEPTEAAKKPEGTAAIVEYFNTAVNKVKTDAKSVKQNHVTNYLAKSPTIPGGLIAGFYKTLGGDDWLDETLVKNGHGAATYTGADIDAKFPVEGESWASKLTAADVKSATCTEKNGVYTITIVTKADGKSDSVKHGQGHNPKAFNVVLPGTINDNIPGIAAAAIGLSTVDYPYGKAVITVDAETGNVKTAEYDIQWTINFDKMNVIVPLGTRSSYVVTF